MIRLTILILIMKPGIRSWIHSKLNFEVKQIDNQVEFHRETMPMLKLVTQREQDVGFVQILRKPGMRSRLRITLANYIW